MNTFKKPEPTLQELTEVELTHKALDKLEELNDIWAEFRRRELRAKPWVDWRDKKLILVEQDPQAITQIVRKP